MTDPQPPAAGLTLPPGITSEQAFLAALHATVVQRGFTTPEAEAARLANDMSRADDPQKWLADTMEKFTAELAEAQAAIATLPATLQAIAEGEAEIASGKPFVTLDEVVPPADDAPPPPDGGLPLDRIRHYKRLRELQAAADTEAATLKAEANALEAELVEVFAEQGLQKLSVDGKTVYLKRSTFAQRKTGVTADDVKAALRAAGQGDLVTETVNSQTLSAYVREILDSDEGGELPEPLADVLELGERYSLGVTAAGGSRTSKTRK